MGTQIRRENIFCFQGCLTIVFMARGRVVQAYVREIKKDFKPIQQEAQMRYACALTVESLTEDARVTSPGLATSDFDELLAQAGKVPFPLIQGVLVFHDLLLQKRHALLQLGIGAIALLLIWPLGPHMGGL